MVNGPVHWGSIQDIYILKEVPNRVKVRSIYSNVNRVKIYKKILIELNERIARKGRVFPQKMSIYCLCCWVISVFVLLGNFSVSHNFSLDVI